MATTELIATDERALRAMVEGEVVLPGDEAWDVARRAWNLAVDQQPAAVVFPAGADDVTAVVEHAVRRGLRIAVQGTGHGAAARGGDLRATLLLNMARLTGVEIDPEARLAHVGAGALWGDVAAAAAAHGLAGLAGSSRDVGVVGYVLGGGMGWLARRYGLASESVRAFRVVTAAGEQRRIDADDEPDLFFALRGGGGSYAIVTGLEIELYPVREVYAGSLYWPIERATDVLGRYLEWVEAVPDELTSLGRILHYPDLPVLPEPIRGRSFVAVEAAFLGPEAEGDALIAPLRALGGVAMDTFSIIPAAALADVHGDPPGPVPGVGDGTLLGPLDADALAALVDVAGPGSGTPILSIEVRHLGGALARPRPGHGALGTVPGRFGMFAVGFAPTPEAGAAVGAAIDRLLAALAPWSAGRTYLNFAERPGAAARAFSGDALRRLRDIKAAYDPADLILANHAVPPASRREKR